LPITKTWEELGIEDMAEDEWERWWSERNLDTRQKIASDVSLYPTYEAFWNTKDPEWQDNAVGKRRADLIRAGKIKFSDLVIADEEALKRANEANNKLPDDKKHRKYLKRTKPTKWEPDQYQIGDMPNINTLEILRD
jgi:hypothetical protein